MCNHLPLMNQQRELHLGQEVLEMVQSFLLLFLNLQLHHQNLYLQPNSFARAVYLNLIDLHLKLLDKKQLLTPLKYIDGAMHPLQQSWKELCSLDLK